MDVKAQLIIDDFENMKNHRCNFDNLWQEIAQRINPVMATFTSNVNVNVNVAAQAQQKFDSTAARALPKFASIMKSIICPRTRQWSKFCTTNPELNDYFADYFDEITRINQNIRYSNRSGFDSATDLMFAGAGLFGQMPYFVDERKQTGIYYRTFAMSDVWCKVNAYGEKDVFVRKFTLDTRQALGEFGDALPKDIFECKDRQKKWDFIHYVCPNEDYQEFKQDKTGMQYCSYYLSLEHKSIISSGGYHTIPYALGRVSLFPTEDVYGYGPAMEALPEQKVLNALMRLTMKSAELQADPEVLVREDAVINFDQFGAAGSIIQGGVDENGKPAAVSMQRNTNMQFAQVLREELRTAINDSFVVSLLNLLINDPTAKTATEVMIKKQEQAVLLAPMVTRFYQEWASSVCMREFDINNRAGKFPSMPKDLETEILNNGGKMTIEFASPLDDAQASEDAIKLNRYFEAMTPLAQIAPQALSIIDPLEASRIFARSLGVPAKAIRSPQEVAQAQEQQNAAAQAQALLSAAPVITQSAKNIADAKKQAQGVNLI